LRRIQFIEIQDKPWCPDSLRDAITDTLQFGMVLFNICGPIFPLLAKSIESSGATRILDLNSGAGGPWPRFQRMFEKKGLDKEIQLSDKYPNIRAFSRLSRISNG
jgi:hypothetical protein